MITRVPVVNPELEAIRRNVPDPPNVTEECFNDWLARSANYSFKQLTTRNQVGWNILHDVAKFVDGTPVGANGDWKQLAGFLGLHIHDIVVSYLILSADSNSISNSESFETY